MRFCDERNRANTVVLLGAVALPCRADTVYSYQSNVYTSCFGTYSANPCKGNLSITFQTTLTGTQLDNLADADITATMASFTMTDGMGVSVNNTNSTASVIVIDTDSAGNIIQWSILAANDGVTGPTTGVQFGAQSCNDALDPTLASSGACEFIPLVNNSKLGDYTFFETGTLILDASGGRSVSPAAWSAPLATPEPASILLVGAGLIGMSGVKRKFLLGGWQKK